ncbi:hypothetical protein ACJJTC_002257 [Scirpophaga incertulas]
MDSENVTIRKGKPTLHVSNSSLNQADLSQYSGLSGYLAKSLPDLSTVLQEDIEELKSEIINLRLQLENCHQEIENLNYENTILKKQVDNSQNVIARYKKICTESPTYVSTPKSRPKNAIKQTKLAEQLSIGQKCKNVQTDGIGDATKQMMSSKSPPRNSANTTMKSSPSLTTASTIVQQLKEQSRNIQPRGAQQQHVNSKPLTRKPKIHIFGGEQCRYLASVLISSRQQASTKYEVTSIIKPNATSREILKSCERVTDSDNDYMIICLVNFAFFPTKSSTEKQRFSIADLLWNQELL